MGSIAKRHFSDALKIADIQFFLGAVAFYAFASRALAVVIGFQIYRMTHSALALGWLGLIEALPALSLVLFGGHAADHFNRRKILLITRALSFLCALALAWISSKESASVFGLYAAVFFFGMARGFADPASTALEAQVVPKFLTVNASSWITSTWLCSAVLGPAVIGFVFDAWGAVMSYTVITFCVAFSWICTALISPKPDPVPESDEPVLKSISVGWRFVFANQPLLAALALDLFAVLFGGAIALLPIYASDILHVGAKGLGFMNAAPFLGSIIITLMATHKPPIEKAGRNLLFTVSGFGVCILIFAFSKNFVLSLVMLFLSGLFDGVSVVIRRSMLRLLSPDALRGRVAAANWIFICASNELGAFESGLLASWIGAIPCVAVGGVLTLVVVAVTAAFAPKLRGLHFDPHTLEQREFR